MGRKVNLQNVKNIVQNIQNHDGQLRAADIARETGLHPQAVARLLVAVEETAGILLQEDSQGRLGIFKRKSQAMRQQNLS